MLEPAVTEAEPAIRDPATPESWSPSPAPSPSPVPAPAVPPPVEPAAGVEPQQPDAYPAFAHEPPFKPRRNRARLLTIAAVVLFVLLSAAAAAVAWFGVPTIGGLALGSEETPLIIEETRKPERRMMESGNELLAVSGRIVNRTDEVQRVPPQIRAELHDAQGRVVYNWSIASPVEQLQPGQSATFNSAQVDVPRGARTLRLAFASTF